ncbi:ABC transporter substrate-binding protein [Marinomonas ostreistagni]|uniref:ABC transporter substrate-binding protein n=1 Tax=Marinomonas ostreistagni TaxID=359209 RepID=UPI0019514221|nr:ABC transporter substrate-binding protein [Marinomonas ostreistagni]MBM6550874.1 ABC transporter substrate-binding protein [Marinomonas ostreistagni]
MRFFTSSLAGAISALALATTPVNAEPTDQNTVKINAAFEFSSIDPSRSGYVFTRMQIFETLLNVDNQGNLTPGLASAWDILEGGHKWRLSLRDDVVYHNDTPMTADSVVKALRIATEKPGAWQGVPVTSIEVVDAQHIDINLSQPFQPLGAILANYASAILAPQAYGEDNLAREAIGTGPFSVYQIAVPHRLVVEKFDDYWGKVAEIEYARYLTGHRAEARVLQARSGQGDIVFGLDPAAVPTLKRLPNLEIIRSDLPRTLVVKVNASHPSMDTVEARQALSLALNRRGIAAAVLRAPEAATAQILPAYMADWHVADTSVEQDLEQAKALLQAQGWQTNSDGWLEKDGQRFEIDMITYADRPELTTVATAIQDQWRQLGVKLNVSITNSSAIPAGHADDSLDTALMARNYGVIADPLGSLLKDLGGAKGGDWGTLNWDNQGIKTTLNELLSESDPSVYRQKAQTVAQALYDEKPLIPVASYVQQTAVNKRLEGFRFDPYERSYFLNELSWVK